MLEVSDSKLAQYVVHYMGDQLVLGQEAFPQPEVMLEAAFTQLSFHKLDLDQQYAFFHETNIGLNEVYTYVKSIFDNPTSFLEQSQYIAKHLHSVSQHPNIKNGELFTGFFENCLFQDEVRQVIAIVKIEEKEMFLDVKSDQNNVIVNGIDGINVKKANNMCVIIDMGQDEEPAVFLKTKRKEDVVYWQERFLKLKVADESYHKTNLALTECKKYILKEETFTNTDKLGFLNKTLEYFRNEEEFQVEDYIETVFEQANEVQKDVLINTVKPYETEISESAIVKAEKNYKRKIKLDDNIEIQVNVRDIEKVNELIEVGYDEVTNRKFYKIYFEEEV
ncbi:nucleoid-associated protein [Psychrobacillus sp. NEAU-3TGS]|uniref:nucleoid-associated protein n=1 Tax=Psychrobacillus sp. NEAU-3TGS TaxID=2995412 RepID=UPI002495F449|nr:nucleoid-associated protein [Psychrobacillus sp. NEAU-3TGS]MDI2585619.1 nucleoid-associated protein [Psychrobacillus sp. NEAU-3TGS]